MSDPDLSDADLSVVIFAFNEEANIAPVLLELRQWLSANEPSAEIVFVDDGSLDHTSAEAAKALSGTPHQLVRHDTNRGIGAALKSGVRAAKGAWVTFLPADGQIAPDADWDASRNGGQGANRGRVQRVRPPGRRAFIAKSSPPACVP